MPAQNKPDKAPSPFEIVIPGKSKKGGNRGLFITIAIVAFLILSVIAGVLLVRQQQLVQEKAAILQCPGAEACPASGGDHLLNCHPAESDNSPTDSLCDSRFVDRVEFCGTSCFKCNGVSWTNQNNTSCLATPTPTPTATPVPTPTPTPTPTRTPSPTPTPTPVAQCNSNCDFYNGPADQCGQSLSCLNVGTGAPQAKCRNPQCSSSTSCVCAATTTPSPSPTPTATPVPQCNSNCTTSSQCPSGLTCSVGKCRNASCSSTVSCICATPTPTPTSTSGSTSFVATPTPSAVAVYTAQTTPRPIPATGTDWPTFMGVGIGVVAIILSLLVAL